MEITARHRQLQWQILLTTYFAYVGYYLIRKVYGIVKTSLVEEFHWTLQDTAHIWTAYLVAYAVGQFMNGFIGRKIGPKYLILAGLGISMGCTVVFGMTNSYATFMLFMIINGLAQASGWPGVVGGIAHWLAPKERGSIMGIWSSSYLVGNMLVKWIGAYFLAHMGWRYAFLGMTALTLIIWIAVLLFQKDKPEDAGLAPIIAPEDEEKEAIVHEATAERITFKDYLNLAASPAILLMGASYFCVKFLRYALDSWLPAFLSLQGMGKAEAAVASSYFDGAGIVGAIVAGFLLGRVFNNNWVRVCLIMGIGCVLSYGAVIYFGTSPTMIAILFGSVGFMLYGPDTIICGAAAVTVAGERNALAAAGLINALGSIGPIVQEEVIGFLVDKDHPEVSLQNTNYLFLFVSALFVVLLLVQTYLYRKRTEA